jgi:hypothetical protein
MIQSPACVLLVLCMPDGQLALLASCAGLATVADVLLTIASTDRDGLIW